MTDKEVPKFVGMSMEELCEIVREAQREAWDEFMADLEKKLKLEEEKDP